MVSGGGGSLVVEQLALATVGVGGEGEVERGDGLALGDGVDELRPRSSGERVVGLALLADRRRRRGGQVLAAGRAGAVGRVDERVVGKREQLLVAASGSRSRARLSAVRPTEVSRSGRPTSPMNSVSPVSTAHGSRVRRRRRTTIEIDLGRVARGVADLERRPRRATAAGRRRAARSGSRSSATVAVGDDGAGGVGQLEVAGEEVGVEVGLDDPLDVQPVRPRRRRGTR